MDGAESHRRLGAAERREHLLEAALEMAAGGDVGSLSVRDLAAYAGVSEGLLYHYFPNKQALVTAAIRRAADSLMADLDAAGAAGVTAQDRLAAGLRAYLDHVERQPTGWRAALQAHSGDLGAISDELEQHSLRLMYEALGAAAPTPALEVALNGWLAFERATCLAWIDHPVVERPTIEMLLLSSFISAVTAVASVDEETQSIVDHLLQA